MSEPIGNTEQLPIAWIEHHKGGDNLNWEEVNHPYSKATPLYAHPMRELSDEEIIEVYKKVIESYGHDFAYTYARAILKKASEK
jgi:hypothetical protein